MWTVHRHGERLELRAPFCTMALSVAQLTLAQVWLERMNIISIIHLWWLPIVVGLSCVVDVVVESLVGVVMAIVVGVVIVILTMLNSIGRGGNDRGRSLSLHNRHELSFMVEQSFVNFSDARRYVFPFDLINDGLVVICEAIKNQLNLIFMIKRFAKDGKLIQSRHDPLKVPIDGFEAFGVVF